MLRCFRQELFEPQSFDDTGLNVHERMAERANSVVLFIHGLNGSGYGTWREWPRMVFEAADVDPLDVAVYDYLTNLKALIKARRFGADLDFHATQLAHLLRQLADKYANIYIVAHSLGGLLSEAAVQRYIVGLGNHAAEMTNVAALIMLASPRSGSRFAPSLLRPFVSEFRWLHRHSKQAAVADNFFSTRVESKAVASAVHRAHVLPRYVAAANYDRVVKNMSATFGVPDEQRLPLKGTHTSIVKPTEDNNPQHRWLLQIVREVQELRTQWRRSQDHQRRTAVPHSDAPVNYLVTELRSDRRQARWERAYNEARAAAGGADLIVYDQRQSINSATVDLLITVHESDAIIENQRRVREAFNSAYDDHERHPHLSVVVSPVGPTYIEAENVVLEWLPKQPNRDFSVTGARDADMFRQVVADWINVVAFRDTRRSMLKAGNDLALDTNYLEENAGGTFL